MDMKELKARCLTNLKYNAQMEKICIADGNSKGRQYSKGQKDAWARMGTLLAIYFKEPTKESEKGPSSCTEPAAKTELLSSDGGLPYKEPLPEEEVDVK